MKTFYIIFLSLLSINLWSQVIPNELIPEYLDYDVCSSPNNNSSSVQQVISLGNCTSVSDYGKTLGMKFIPTLNQPIINVRLNLIFLQKSDGTGNFQENNQEHQSFINDIVTDINRIYSTLTNPNDPTCYAGTDFVPDTKIRFVANKIFIKDNYGWNNRNDKQSVKCPEAYPSWYLDYLDKQIVNNPTIPRGINIYFTEDSLTYNKYWIKQPNDTANYTGASYACSQFPTYSDYVRTSKIHMVDQFSKYWWMKNIVPKFKKYNYPAWDPTVRYWDVNGIAILLGHEIGHTFYLFHPSSPYYPSSNCFSTLMNPSGGGSHNSLPPPEIGRIYSNLSLSNVRSFVPEDTYLGTKEINTVETWNNNMRLYHSLNILANAELNSNCNKTMPYQSNFQVFGRLTINNSNINSIKNDWGGIVVKSGGLLVLNTTIISDYNVFVESGGTIIIKGSLSMTGSHNITIQGGGYICIETGTTIQLTDVNSLIKINEGTNYGVNPSLSLQSNCVSLTSSITTSGNGSIADFNQDVYIQNMNISASKYIGGRNIYVGNHVTTTKSYGDVLVNGGANVIFDCKEITFDTGFECASGSSYEVKNH